MKRTILLLLSVMMTVIMTAGNVTPEQALQQAQDFLQQTPSGMKRSQAEVPQLKMAGRVSGLYVFNAEGNQGFVIVSNDDRTAPILGYSETGNLDPDNMPCNMRAWLQGYADEIAWLDEHNVQLTGVADSRRASAVKTPIAPLVKTQWDQGAPYNELCPNFFSHGKCLTGCGATAMAQMMYYTATQAGLASSETTAEIPGYTFETSWPEGQITVDTIPAGYALDWYLMTATYDGSSSDESKTAVAKLMKACGTSVNTLYGTSESGGSESQVDPYPDAFKNYFGYAETVQAVDRSQYTYANWLEMIYHELSEGRVVFYFGQSPSLGGHAFVCDGYQGEDYFHINWGWGGDGDSYFKLSVLNPYDDNPSGGFYALQGAVLGVQLVGYETGTVLSNPSTIDLTLNSVSSDRDSLSVGESAYITFSITNNSSDDYEGEIDLEALGQDLFYGKIFLIPAGQTRDCIVEYMPTLEGTYKLTACRLSEQDDHITIDASKYVSVTVTASEHPFTDNVDLSFSADYEMPVEGGDFYGSTFMATITVTNDTDDNYSGYVVVDLINLNYDRLFISSAYQQVPAHSSIQIPVEAEGLEYGIEYYVTCCYMKDGNWSNWYNLEILACKPGITATDASGQKTIVKPTATYDVPANAVSVDMRNAGVTTVNKNGNPNTLYILGAGDVVPWGLTNVVTLNDDGRYSSNAITLTDGYAFYSPVNFTANRIEFTYNHDRFGNGKQGWNTIMLPFDVSSVTVNDRPVDWFHSGSDTGKRFWLREFVSDDPGVVNFADVSGGMKANTPYLIAFPFKDWNAPFGVGNIVIKFVGEYTDVLKNSEFMSLTAGNYIFAGTTLTDATPDIYTINAVGNRFDLGSGCAPFRAYFKTISLEPAFDSLSIGTGGGTTGIYQVESEKMKVESSEIYDLSGRHVENPAKGVYIQNGRKIVIK